MTSSQKYQVCLQMTNNELKIIEFQVFWVPNKTEHIYTTRVQLIGQKLITQKQYNIGTILFFAPLFKSNYEIIGTQIIQKEDNKLSYLNLENTRPYEFQFRNEIAEIAYMQDSNILIVEVLFSQKLLQEKNISC
jgi:hypothetical protein